MRSLLLLSAVLAGGQEFGSLEGPPVRNHQYVTYAAEQQLLPEGKDHTLEVHFHVERGYHINSHTPKSELLLPTRVELQPADGVKLLNVEYPAGKEYSFAFDPKEKLDVYADEFVVKVRVGSGPGLYSLHGVLRYQACDKAACYPPRSLPFDVPFTVQPGPPPKPIAAPKRTPAG